MVLSLSLPVRLTPPEFVALYLFPVSGPSCRFSLSLSLSLSHTHTHTHRVFPQSFLSGSLPTLLESFIPSYIIKKSWPHILVSCKLWLLGFQQEASGCLPVLTLRVCGRWGSRGANWIWKENVTWLWIRCGFLIHFCLDAAPKMDWIPS